MLVARPVSGGGPFQRCLKLSSGYPNHGHRTFEKHQNAPPISFNWWYLYYVYINYIKSMQWWLHAHHCLRKNAPTTCNIHPKYMTLVKVTTNFPNIHGFGYVFRSHKNHKEAPGWAHRSVMEFATTSSRDQPGRTGKRTILDKHYRMPLNLRSVDSSEFKWELCLI